MEYNFKVKGREHGMSLENFLYEKMGNWSHRQIKNAIDKKRAFINSKNVFISKWNIKKGDQVLFYPRKSDYPKESSPQKRYSFVQVLHEDDDIIVCDKPAFMNYDNFVSEVNAYLKRKYGKQFYPYLGQMHRLDKETSGILVFTKKKRANKLAAQFRNRTIKKYYMALVHGQVEKEHGFIRKSLEKNKFEGGKKVQVSSKGKDSLTEYWVKERYEEATLLRVRLATGRTHQIRVHFADLGHPLLGDKLYGIKTLPGQKLPLKRQALHAAELEFVHPLTHKTIKIKSPLPQDMSECIDAYREGIF